jgi:Zn finger protein HypA/HybF involved in hydrogenase expression
MKPTDFITAEIHYNGKSYGIATWCPNCQRGFNNDEHKTECPHCGKKIEEEVKNDNHN